MTGDSNQGWNVFLKDFYQRFVASDAAVAQKFKHTNMDRQIRMLQVSLQAMLAVGVGGAEPVGFQQIAEIHSANDHDVQRSLYVLWLEAFLETVHERDPEVTPVLLKEWREVLEEGIEHMLKFYLPDPETRKRG